MIKHTREHGQRFNSILSTMTCTLICCNISVQEPLPEIFNQLNQSNGMDAGCLGNDVNTFMKFMIEMRDAIYFICILFASLLFPSYFKPQPIYIIHLAPSAPPIAACITEYDPPGVLRRRMYSRKGHHVFMPVNISCGSHLVYPRHLDDSCAAEDELKDCRPMSFRVRITRGMSGNKYEYT